MSSASREITHILQNLVVCYHSHNSSASHKIQPLVRTSEYHRFVLYSTLGHVEGGKRCGGYTLLGQLLQHTLANGALVYPSKGESNHAEGHMALGWR